MGAFIPVRIGWKGFEKITKDKAGITLIMGARSQKAPSRNGRILKVHRKGGGIGQGGGSLSRRSSLQFWGGRFKEEEGTLGSEGGQMPGGAGGGTRQAPEDYAEG